MFGSRRNNTRSRLSWERVDENLVIQQGLAPGETVVTDGQLRLTPKSKVEVKNAF